VREQNFGLNSGKKERKCLEQKRKEHGEKKTSTETKSDHMKKEEKEYE
jgi:hypothetical protein